MQEPHLRPLGFAVDAAKGSDMNEKCEQKTDQREEPCGVEGSRRSPHLSLSGQAGPATMGSSLMETCCREEP